MDLAVEIAMAEVVTLTERLEVEDVIMMDVPPLQKIGQFHYQEMSGSKMNCSVRNIYTLE